MTLADALYITEQQEYNFFKLLEFHIKQKIII